MTGLKTTQFNAHQCVLKLRNRLLFALKRINAY